MAETISCRGCETAFPVHEELDRAVCPDCGLIHERVGWASTDEYVGERPDYADDEADSGTPRNVVRAGVRMTDDDIIVLTDDDGQTRRLEPSNRSYQVLYIAAIYQAEIGPGFRAGEVYDAYDGFLPSESSVSGGLSRLRSFGAVEKTDPFAKQGFGHRVTKTGVEYLKRHGKPKKYDAPEDVNGVLDG